MKISEWLILTKPTEHTWYGTTSGTCTYIFLHAANRKAAIKVLESNAKNLPNCKHYLFKLTDAVRLNPSPSPFIYESFEKDG